MMYVVI